MKYIYSNCIGTFVFDKGKLIDKIIFSGDTQVPNALLLEEGKVLTSETKMLAKFTGAKLVGVGSEKSGKLESVPRNLLKFFAEPEYLKLMREVNIRVVKKKMSLSVTPDLLISQAISNMDELNKVSHILVKRLREWYELHNPEFSRSMHSHEKFVELVLKKDRVELLRELKLKPEDTMGVELEPEDLVPIQGLAERIDDIYRLRQEQGDYIETAMKKNYPNLFAVAGALIGAKIILLGGGVARLIMLPASTVQLLGAEKALFRHIKSGSRPPKYGVIINHPLVTSVRKDMRGKAARALADKISIAIKVDYFKGEFVGDKLLLALEKKFNV